MMYEDKVRYLMILRHPVPHSRQCVAVCCSVLQCVAVCCSVLQCVAVCCSMLQCVAVYLTAGNVSLTPHSITRVAMCCSVLQCVAVCCSMLQYVAVCCSVLQCIAMSPARLTHLFDHLIWHAISSWFFCFVFGQGDKQEVALPPAAQP